MKLAIILILNSLLLQCMPPTEEPEPSVTRYMSTIWFSYADEPDFIDTTEIIIAHWKGHTLYRTSSLEFQNYFSVDTLLGTSELRSSSVRTIYHYYVLANGNGFGIKYDETFAKKQKFNVDSLLERYSMTPWHFELFYTPPSGGPSEVIKKERGTIIEKYLNIKTVKDDPDSVYNYYNKHLKNLKFSLSKYADSVKKSKLYKVTDIYLPAPKKKGGKKTLRREFSTEIGPCRECDKKLLLGVFKKFEKDKVLFSGV